MKRLFESFSVRLNYLWVIGVIFGLALITFDPITLKPRAALPEYIWLILAIQIFVLFMAIIHMISAMHKVIYDNKDLDLAEDIFRDDPILDMQTHSAEYSTNLMRTLLNAVREDGLLAFQIESIHRIGLSGASIDIRQLSELMSPELTSRIRTFKVLVSSTVLFGLFGTVIGLSMTVLELQPLFDLVKMEIPSILMGMGNAFRGMQTAFITTIVGITSSLILNLFPSRNYSKKLNTWQRRLDRLTLFELIPRLSSGPSSRAIERATKNLGEMAEIVKVSVQTLAQQTQRIASEMSNLLSFISVFDKGSQRIAGSLDNLSGHYDNMQSIFNKIEGSIGKINELVESDINSVRSYHKDLTDYQLSVGTVVDRVANLLSDLKGDRADFTNAVSKFLLDIQDHRSQITTNENELINQYQQINDTLDKNLGKIGDNLSLRLSQIFDHIDEILTEHAKNSSDTQHLFVDQAIERLSQSVERGLDVHRHVTRALVLAGFGGGDGNEIIKKRQTNEPD